MLITDTVCAMCTKKLPKGQLFLWHMMERKNDLSGGGTNNGWQKDSVNRLIHMHKNAVNPQNRQMSDF